MSNTNDNKTFWINSPERFTDGVESAEARTVRICIEQQVPFIVTSEGIILVCPSQVRINKLLQHGVIVTRDGQKCTSFEPPVDED